MNLAPRSAGFLLGLALVGCASAPPASHPIAPLAGSSGLVIGTLSYQYLETAPSVVHFERLDPSAPVREYALPVDVDRENQSGVFAGALPAGVYAFREVQSANRRFAAGALKMPFEVTAGSVQDAGHYAISPLTHH